MTCERPKLVRQGEGSVRPSVESGTKLSENPKVADNINAEG